MDGLMRRWQDAKEPRDAHGRANAATFMDELVQRCQDGKELPVAGRQRAACLVLQKFPYDEQYTDLGLTEY